MENTRPKHIPRRPLDDSDPDGYLESDKDYVLNNFELAVMLLDELNEKESADGKQG